MDAANERSRTSLYAAVAAIALVASFAGWVTTTSLQQDFAAYWVAGAARRAGLDPYVNHAPRLWDGVAVFAHSRFLYPPVVAEAFRPFALLPYAAAKALFTALLVVAWAVAAARIAARGSRPTLIWISAAASYPVLLALERGQVELIVLALLVAAFDDATRPVLAGAALGAAAALKPGLLLAVLVLAALGRGRVVAWATATLAGVAVASLGICGTTITHEYATVVLPRAALFGEGGDETMLLPGERLAEHADDLAAGIARVDGRVYRQAAWDGPVSASLPRVLAPVSPTKLTTRLPALAFALLLIVAALSARRRSPERLPWAAAVAAVVASPAGWVMGLVVALPLVLWLTREREPRTVPRVALGAALLACLCPPLLPGLAAVAAATLVTVVAVSTAVAPRDGR
ncbi:MAG TPA: glycosyltransferase family 87 protein [Minicystis sp.]|nr:glycosyltransferase family 87 protein [Minicystis sp.]